MAATIRHRHAARVTLTVMANRTLRNVRSVVFAALYLGACGTSDSAPGLGADAGGGTGTQCDADGDHALAAACGGNDCCDTDWNVHPGQTAYFNVQSACHSFDYDCDGKATGEHLGSSSCIPDGIEGACRSGGVGVWLDSAPACGKTGRVGGSCRPSAPCVFEGGSSMTQNCR